MRARAVAFAALVLMAGAVAAQDAPVACEVSDTLEKCWQRFNPDAGNVPAMVATTNTGLSPVALPGGSSLRDFISIFQATVQTANVTEGNNAVTLDWNVPFGAMSDDDKLKLQATFTTAALAADVTTALASNSAAIQTLSSGLSEIDDVTASVSYSPVSMSLGRSLGPHDLFFQALLGANEDAKDTALASFFGSLAGVKTTAGTVVDETTVFSDLAPDVRARVMTDLQARARAEAATAGRAQDMADAFVLLLNNQPQFYGTASYRSRNELVGANVLAGKLTYEMLGPNLNKFRRKYRNDCEQDKLESEARGEAPVDESTRCLNRLLSYANQLNTNARASKRLALSVEYQQNRTRTVDDPQFSLHLVTPESHSLVYAITYGVPMSTPLQNREGRFDFSINYDNVSNDPTRNDRLIGAVTYTQKLSDTLTVPISFVYANHGVYLPEGDRRLGVHFGVSYKLPDLTP